MNQVLNWNEALLEATRWDFTAGHLNNQHAGPTRTSRAMALFHLSIYNAIAAVRDPGAAFGIVVPAAANANLGDVIDGAASHALLHLYPGATELVDGLLLPGGGPDREVGVAIAAQMLASRYADGSQEQDPPAPVQASYGAHARDPFEELQPLLGKSWGKVVRFTGGSPRSVPPFPGHGGTDLVGNSEYRVDYDEVRTRGARMAPSRSSEEATIGTFWAYDGANGIGVPPRLYNQIVVKLILDRQIAGDIGQTAWLLAKTSVAMADAAVDCWHHKYQYNLWRPVLGIRQERNGVADPFWSPLGAPRTNSPGKFSRTPAFPAYPSGHATFGAAVFQILSKHLRSKDMTLKEVLDWESKPMKVDEEAFTFTSDELDGKAVDSDGSTRTHLQRNFMSFAQCVWENAISRVFLGVHWRFDGMPRDPSNQYGGVPLGLDVGKDVHVAMAAGQSLCDANQVEQR
jgi:hypothetical protein